MAVSKPIKLSARARKVLALMYEGSHAHLYHRIRAASSWGLWQSSLSGIGKEIAALGKAGLITEKHEGSFVPNTNAYITAAGRAYHEANPVEEAATWWHANWGDYPTGISSVKVGSATESRITLDNGRTEQRVNSTYGGYYPTKEEAVAAFLDYFRRKIEGAKQSLAIAEHDLTKAKRIVAKLS